MTALSSGPANRANVPRTCGELEQALDRLDALVSQHAQLAAQTAAEMRMLAEICEARFASEEDSSLSDDVRERSPWMQQRLEDVFGEHETLRSRLSSLCSCSTRQQPLPRPWMEFSEELRFFRRQLVVHEAAEFELWQQAYGMDVGTKD
jgi:hypothetical protein